MALIHLAYVSSASHELENEELIELLAQSRDRNSKLKVTGMLLYSKGCFIQVLEGEQPQVQDIYNSILRDDRNRGNTLLLNEEISERAFPSWSMGFRSLGSEDIGKVEGYSEFLELDNKDILDNSVVVMKLLNGFKDNA